MIRYQLSRAIAFAWIRGSGLNAIRYAVPAGVTFSGVLLFTACWYATIPLPLVKVSATASSVLVNLPGFYIAALAAVAAFQSSSLNNAIETPGAQLKVISKGGKHEINLTYRMYLCYLFAYLAVLSFVLSFLFAISSSMAELVRDLLPRMVADGCNFVGSVLLTFWMINLITVSLHGLYFLAERMHRPSA